MRHAEEQLREQIRTTDARLAAQARRLTDWEVLMPFVPSLFGSPVWLCYNFHQNLAANGATEPLR